MSCSSNFCVINKNIYKAFCDYCPVFSFGFLFFCCLFHCVLFCFVFWSLFIQLWGVQRPTNLGLMPLCVIFYHTSPLELGVHMKFEGFKPKQVNIHGIYLCIQNGLVNFQFPMLRVATYRQTTKDKDDCFRNT